MKNRCKKGMVLSLKCQGWGEGSRGKTMLYAGKGAVLTNHFLWGGCRPFLNSIEFVITLLLFYVYFFFFLHQGMLDLSSLTRELSLYWKVKS